MIDTNRLSTLREKIEHAEGLRLYTTEEPEDPQTKVEVQVHQGLPSSIEEDPSTDPQTSLEPRVMSLRDAFLHPEYLVPPTRLSRLAWRGLVSLCIGDPKVGKSTIMCSDATDAVKAGHRILYITLDEPIRNVIRRFKKHGEPLVEDQVAILHPEDVTKLNTWERIGKLAADFQPDLLYLDSWDTVISQCEKEIPAASETTPWRRIANHLIALGRDLDIGVIMAIHTLKSDGTRYAGSGQIGAAMDMTVIVTEEADDLRRLEFRGRESGVEPVLLKWDNRTDMCRDVGNAGDRNMTDEQEDILMLLTNGMMTKQNILDSTGLKEPRFFKEMAPMTKRGWVGKQICGQSGKQTCTYTIKAEGKLALDILQSKVKPSTNPVTNLLGGTP